MRMFVVATHVIKTATVQSVNELNTVRLRNACIGALAMACAVYQAKVECVAAGLDNSVHGMRIMWQTDAEARPNVRALQNIRLPVFTVVRTLRLRARCH